MSQNVRKRTFRHMRLAKMQISLCFCAVWSESSLSTLDSQECNCFSFSCGQWRFWSDSADDLADWRLHWMHISEGTVSHVAAQITANTALLRRYLGVIAGWAFIYLFIYLFIQLLLYAFRSRDKSFFSTQKHFHNLPNNKEKYKYLMLLKRL